MQEGVLAVCGGALALFEELGAQVEPVVPKFAPERLWQSWLVLRQWRWRAACRNSGRTMIDANN